MTSRAAFCFLLGFPCILAALRVNDYDPKSGTFLGSLQPLMHGVRGDIYAIDDITILIRRFSYDGEAPDALFFAGNNTPKPSHRGFIIPDEKGTIYPLHPYRNRDVVLKFPITKKGQRSFNDIKWISIWCRKFAVDFGHIKMPTKMNLPSAYKGGSMRSNRNEIQTSNVIMKDSDTFVLEGFNFDGTVNDAVFVMGSGAKNAEGYQVADERGSMHPIKRMTKRSLTLKVPKLARGQHVQYFGIWSPTKGMLSSVTFPHDMRIPPSTKNL